MSKSGSNDSLPDSNKPNRKKKGKKTTFNLD